MVFTKMQCCGNDYIYVDTRVHPVPFPEKEAVFLCDRHRGIGADGLVLICESGSDDYRMRIFDPDGTEAEFCGNALRSSAYLVYLFSGRKKNALSVETAGGQKRVYFPAFCDGKGILCDVGMPEVGFIEKEILLDDTEVKMTSLSFGNPHCVIFTEALTDEVFARLGAFAEKHPLFPERTNVEFVTVQSRDRLLLRTWERGCGETLSCASGSAAACAAAVLTGKAERKVWVGQGAGDLLIEWKEDGSVFVTGDTEIVFTGEIDLPEMSDTERKNGHEAE